MKKIIVVGCPGSGKSTFSRELNRITHIPLFHLDMMYWNADKTTVDKNTFYERLSDVLEKEQWIIDGNYASTMELRLRKSDTVFFLDYPTEICLDGITKRRGKPRSDIPWIESDDSDSEFIEFIKRYRLQNRPEVFELLGKYSDKSIFIFTERNQADEFLVKLQKRILSI
ncbi:MAG: adenylate kinase [Ruminococcaceae bacterium]|nr:adenylate kinase [Oscillospiraceae bacterium]